MVEASVKIDPTKFQRSFKRFFQDSRREKQKVLRQQAKLFVRDVVQVTPPNRKSNWNRKGGEQTILNDLSHIVIPAKKGENAFTVHKRLRTRNGRVSHSVIPVAATHVFKLKRVLFSHVGILAAGWNAAAQKLGVKFPSWITRHGTGHSQCSIRIASDSMSIRITNAAKFAGNVRGLVRRVQWALNNRARQMDKQMKAYAVRKAARSAGFNMS